MSGYIDAVIGEREGFLAFAFGRTPFWDGAGKYKHRDWTETRFQWPSERDKIRVAVDQELASGEPVDIYICPAVRFTPDRRKGSARPPMVCWADLDGPPADIALWDTLNPLVVDSGQPDHRHAYVPLTRPVGLGAHARLNKALADRLGGDAKWSDESLLRLPGSFNFKPATPRNGEPAGEPARVLARPWSGTPWDPAKLAEILGVDLEQSDGAKSSQTVDGEPVDLEKLPAWLRERSNDSTKPEDASEAFHGLVGACRDAKLTQGQTVTVMDSWRHLPDRYRNRVAEEVARSWGKVKAGPGLDDAAAPTVGLPEEFWTKRKYLRHIRDAAWSRGRSAEAVLGVVLARVAADMGYIYKLPPLVGARCGLDLIVTLTATSGGGKSSAKAIGGELLPARRIEPVCDEIPPGSGEGLIDVLFDLVTEEGPGGKTVKVKRQMRYNAFVYADEGEVLAATARRNTTSTLLPNMRSIFSGAALGQANASEERKRRVPAGRYAYGIVVAIQPSRAGPLFDDLGVGTPQRILWLPARTDTPPPDQRPGWPGPIPRGAIKPRPNDVVGGQWVDFLIHPDIADEIKANDYQRHIHGCDPLDEHRDLVRLKVAGNLAALYDRDDVNLEDWSLAGMVVDLSDTTRRRVLTTLAEEQKRANTSRGRAQGERQLVADQILGGRAMAAAKRQAVTRVVKHHKEHPEQSCPRRCITLSIADKYRKLVSIDDVLDRAVGEDLLVVTTDRRYAPGKRKS